MSKLVKWTALALIAATPAFSDGYGLGQPALPEEIAAWNLDIPPDGSGLPEGRGDVETGDEIFVEKCGTCHGDFAEGRGNWPALAGGFDTLDDRDPVKTVGSYWPYLSTVWDYVHRSMPFGNAQTLETDEVYAIVAYILYSNSIVEDDFELTHESFMEIEMPNGDGFIVDDRPEVEYPLWRTEPCMENCKDSVEITMRATVLDVTPGDDTEDQAAAEPAAEATQEASLDPELVKTGEKVFRKCKACHEIGEGAANKVGPHLNDIFDRVMGSVDGFRYSSGFQTVAEEGRVWTEDEMASFLESPRDYMKGTKMSFAGLRKEEDREAINAYLKAAGQ
jgi:cytochrome c2